MGVDLRLFPLDHDTPEWGFSHTLLSLERRRELWDVIAALPTTTPPANFSTHVGTSIPDGYYKGKATYGKHERDSYGDPIRCTTAGDLCRLAKNQAVRDNAKNRAIWAYLAELDPATRVALDWH